MRLDLFLVQKTGLARHQIQKMIQEQGVTIDGRQVRKPAHPIRGTEKMDYTLPEPPKKISLIPEERHLDILYEDDQIAVINKPADWVIHPAAGHSSGTLVNALLHCYGPLPEGNEANKPGIVHRLDKGTSGCLVIARTGEAMKGLQQQFKNRRIKKIYLALVAGKLNGKGKFDKPLGRHPKLRQKISSRTRKGKEALTEWKVVETFGSDFSWVEVALHTGRTHQIRVHFSEAGFPLIGDPTYGRPSKVKMDGLHRPALHAWKLGFNHPTSQTWMEFEAPLPEDLNQLLKKLRSRHIE